MGLSEVLADRTPKLPTETEMYTGYLHHRRYQCPEGEINTHLAAGLLLGAVMPGESGATPEQARCIAASTPKKRERLGVYLDATFLEIDCGAAALGSTTFRFTTKDTETDGVHEKVKIAYGVALTDTDGGIPARALTDVRDGSNLKGSTPTAIDDYVCRNVTVIDKWRGRVLLRIEYVQFKSGRALSAVVPMSTYYISRGGNSGGGARRKYGEIEYAIPFALVESYRSMFEPGTPTTLTGTFAFNDTTDVLTCSAAVFTSAMVGRFLYPTGKSAKTILVVNSSTSVDVETGGGDWSGVSDARLGVAVWPGDSGPWARRLTDFREIAVCPGRPGFTYVKDTFSVPKPSYVVMEDPGQRAIIEVLTDTTQKKIDREPSKLLTASFTMTGSGTSRTLAASATSYDSARDVGKVIKVTGKNQGVITAVGSTTSATVTVATGDSNFASVAGAALFGRQIEGVPHLYDSSGAYQNKPFFYKIVEGSNLVLDGNAQIRVTTADTSLGLNTILGLVGYTNAAILTNIGPAPIGTMMLFGVDARREYDIDAIWLIKYLFLYDTGKHICGVDKHIAVVIMEKGWWNDPADSETFKERGQYERHVVTMLRPDRVGEPPETRELSKGTADFSNLNGRAAWDS